MKLKSQLLGLAASAVSLLSIAASANAAETGKIYIAGKWVDAAASESSPSTGILSSLGLSGEPSDLRKVVREFVIANAKTLDLTSDQALIPQSIQVGQEFESHRLKKFWKGLEVVGGETLVNLQNGRVALASADNTSLDSLSPTPRLNAEEARRIAFSSYRGLALKAEQPSLQVMVLGDGAERQAKLTYAVKVIDSDQFSSDVHFIDAQTGQEALVTSNVHTLLDRKVWAAKGNPEDFNVLTDKNAEDLIERNFTTLYADKGCGATAGNPCGQADPAVLASGRAAWGNSGLVYDYYQNTHNRNSVDGNGMMIRSIVNFGGERFKNAAWFNDKKVMLYGMGDADQFNDFASPLDVVGHEITHGVTANTAALQYNSESGALNESYSDVFGKLVAFRNGKSSDWKIGRELFRNGTSFIRDMENPEIAHTKDFKYRGQQCNRFNDFCGVHSNSGIPNKAAVLISKQLGLEKLGKLYYLALTQMLRSTSDFKEARAQTEAACATLFGGGSSDCQAVSTAYEAVGI